MNPLLRAIEGDIMGLKRRLRAARDALVPRDEMIEDAKRLRTLKDQAKALRAKLERTDGVRGRDEGPGRAVSR